MLYLFNSAARPEYVKNVLNTLHLPNGAINLYQYETDDSNYVDPEIGQLNANEQVLVVFIDRNDNDPEKNKYLPLRFGTLKKYQKEQGKVYFYVELKNFVRTGKEFMPKFKELFKNKLFYKKNGIENGYLAFSGKRAEHIKKDISNEAWLNTVKRILDCHNLKSTNCTYTHLDIYDKDSIVTPDCTVGKWQYKLKANKKYNIKVHYYIPFASETPNSNTLLFSFSNDLKNIINPINNTWGAKNGMSEHDIILTNSSTKLNLQQHIESSDESQRIVFSDKSIPVILKEKNWFVKLIPIIFFAGSSFVSTFIASMKDYAAVEPQEATNVIDNVAKWISTFSTTKISLCLAICAVIQAFSIFGVKALLSKEK